MKSFYLILLLAFAAIMASCSSGKSQLTYFKDLEQVSTTQMPKSVPLKLGAGDELYILVQADEPKAAAPYNMISSAVGERENILQSNITPKAQTYLVNTRGDIDFPQLGWIHVAGMTVEELQDYLTRRIGQMIDNPIVTVLISRCSLSIIFIVSRTSLGLNISIALYAVHGVKYFFVLNVDRHTYALAKPVAFIGKRSKLYRRRRYIHEHYHSKIIA